MDKKFLINITRSTVLNLKSEEEAEVVASMLVNREQDDFIGNLVYITSDIKELTDAN